MCVVFVLYSDQIHSCYLMYLPVAPHHLHPPSNILLTVSCFLIAAHKARMESVIFRRCHHAIFTPCCPHPTIHAHNDTSHSLSLSLSSLIPAHKATMESVIFRSCHHAIFTPCCPHPTIHAHLSFVIVIIIIYHSSSQGYDGVCDLQTLSSCYL